MAKKRTRRKPRTGGAVGNAVPACCTPTPHHFKPFRDTPNLAKAAGAKGGSNKNTRRVFKKGKGNRGLATIAAKMRWLEHRLKTGEFPPKPTVNAHTWEY